MNRAVILTISVIISSLAGCRPNSSSGTENHTFPTDNTVTVTIEVTTPALSETWEPGTEHIIEWKVSNNVQLVDIELYKKGDYRLTVAEDLGSGTGSFRWKVPDNIPQSRHYRFKVANSLKPAEYGMGNYFYILK